MPTNIFFQIHSTRSERKPASWRQQGKLQLNDKRQKGKEKKDKETKRQKKRPKKDKKDEKDKNTRSERKSAGRQQGNK